MFRYLYALVITGIYLFLGQTDIHAAPTYKQGDTLFVLAQSGLRLRNEPEGKTVLATIPFGAALVMKQGGWEGRESSIDGLKGRWTRVQFNGTEGFVFDGYLSAFPAPKDGKGDLKLYADTFFKKVGEPFHIEFGEEESRNEITVQHYVYKNFYIQYKSNNYYESSDDRLIFDAGYDIRPEELYLLAKCLFKDDIAESLKLIDSGELEEVNEEILGPGVKPDKNYYNRLNSNSCKRVEYQLFQAPCYDSFIIGTLDYTAYICRAGGC